MNHYLIMCRSLTYAQRSKRLLEHFGLSSSIVKAPQCLTPAGCGYALSIYKFLDQAVLVLKNNGMLRGKVYKQNGDGDYEEMPV